MLLCGLVFAVAFPAKVEAKQPNPSKTLEKLIRQYELLNGANMMSEADFSKLAIQYKSLLKQTPADAGVIYIYLGHLYSCVNNAQLRDLPTAVSYYREAVANLDEDDYEYKAIVYSGIAKCYIRPSEMHSLDSSRAYFIKATQLDRSQAVELARMSLFCWGVPQDYFLACCLYDIATIAGWEGGMENYSYLSYVLDQDANGTLDSMFLVGLEKGYFYRHVADRPTRSFSSMMMAAEMGFATAEFEMGLSYSKDPAYMNEDNAMAEAARWYRRAAQKGYDPARAELAWMCFKNVLDTANGACFERLPNGHYPVRVYDQVYDECIQMLQSPANNGYAPAELYLGRIYMHGDPNGSNKHDYAKAYYWLLLARANGMNEVNKELDLLNKMTDNPRDQIPSDEYQRIYGRVHRDARKNDIAITCLNRITHSHTWRKPRYVPSTYYSTRFGTKSIALPNGSDIPQQVEKLYGEVYNIYVGILKDMSRGRLLYTDNDRKHYQQMMMNLRSRARQLNPDANLVPSPWESWDGR